MVKNTETELLAEDWNPDDEAYSEREDELDDDCTGAAQEYQHQLTEFNRAFKDSNLTPIKWTPTYADLSRHSTSCGVL
jgi:murein tripeptide amidase MpaA